MGINKKIDELKEIADISSIAQNCTLAISKHMWSDVKEVKASINEGVVSYEQV